MKNHMPQSAIRIKAAASDPPRETEERKEGDTIPAPESPLERAFEHDMAARFGGSWKAPSVPKIKLGSAA